MVKGKKHLRSIDIIANEAMQMINTLESLPQELEEISIHPDDLEKLCYGYMHLYVLLMESKQMPTPLNQQKFHTIYH